MGRPAKRAKLLDDSDSENGGVALSGDFKVNEEYARRFEHNKKRDERTRLEEKYGKQLNNTTLRNDDGDESDSSTSEEEDDEAELATEALDAEMFDVLNAIRSKDPRVRDKDYKFYKELAEGEEALNGTLKKEKPMNLRDYHRQNLLSGQVGSGGEDDEPEMNGAPKSYVQEQSDLKASIVASMHAEVSDQDDSDANEEAGFLITKSKPELPKQKPILPSTTDADRDPETFLSNFMASRAWTTTDKSAYAPLESDDSDEDARAEQFEHAYNLRFEDPDEANKRLTGHARSAVEKYSVRREELSGRQKAREREKQRKDEERGEREVEKARLKKLMIEEMREKAEKIRKAANLRGKDFKIEEWVEVLNEDWDDSKWENMLAKKFGAEYHAQEDAEINEGEGEDREAAAKVRKPKWDDEIDIKDIVPDFKDEDDRGDFEISDDELASTNGDGGDNNDATDEPTPSQDAKKKAKDRKRERDDKKKAAKRDQRILDAAAQQVVDEDATLDIATSKNKKKSKQAGPVFRYRQTSPSAYGLSALEILAAEDAQLNDWVGLKKLYPFRDEERKRKDKKRMSKKGRLREWRKETFGNREGPRILHSEADEAQVEKTGKKRKRKTKGGAGGDDQAVPANLDA